MRSIGSGRQLLMILCLCGIAGGADPNDGSAVDANEAWIAGEHLAPRWYSLELTTYHFNPDDPESQGKMPLRRLLLVGKIDVTDANGLIGLSTNPTDVSVVDETGRSISIGRHTESPPVYEPVPRDKKTLWAPTGELVFKSVPYEFSLDMFLTPPYPQTLHRIEWSMDALLSDSFEVIDIPFTATGDWMELAPGLDILVEEATAGQTTYRYVIKARYHRRQISYPGDRYVPFRPGESPEAYSWADGSLPETIVTEIDVLDAEGKSLVRWGTGGSGAATGITDLEDLGATHLGDLRILTRTVSGSCSVCGPAAFVRHVLAHAPRVQPVRFVMEDIPIPHF